MPRARITTHRHHVPAARTLRAHGTNAEEILWEAPRGRRLAELKFRRQHPVGPFVIDFCCIERRLAIEVDGGVHLEQGEHDAEREELHVAAGFRVLRFSNEAVRDELPVVLTRIQEVAREEPPARPAAPGRKAGWT